MKIAQRHLAKTITWRIIGTLDTVVLSWYISGNSSMAVQIGGFELVSKMILYYLHERAWFKSKIKNPNKRHVFKTLSWRIIGTLDTIILSWLITGNPLTGIKIGGAEVFSKMILYFGHEKLWYQINFGLDARNRGKRLRVLKKNRIK